MKKILLILMILIFVGCKFHEQGIFQSGKQQNSKFQLEVVESLFSKVVSDDFFGLRDLLKENDINLNTLSKQGQNLLIEAVKLKRDLITRLFIKKGSDPQVNDEKNQNAFEVIKEFEDVEFWKNLLDGKGLGLDFINKKIVRMVSETAEDTQKVVIKKLQIYFANGADVNAHNKRKYTLLILSSSKNLPLLVDFLCKTEGIEVNARAGRYTALSLTKRLMRRNPELSQIVRILESCSI